MGGVVGASLPPLLRLLQPPGHAHLAEQAGAVIRSHTGIYAGSRIGAGFQTGHRAILGPGLEIGANCSIGADSIEMGFAHIADTAKINGL